jgi:APA family basic amino acid/polyamine antiporter
VSIAFFEVGILDWQTLGSSAAPLEDLAIAVTENRLFIDFIAFSALIATASVLLSSIIGGTRASFAMGRDKVLPGQFDKISKRFGTPYFSVTFGGLIIVVLSGLFYNNIDIIASVVNFGSLFTYLLVHLSLIKLRKIKPEISRPFKVPLYPVVPVVGAVSCVLLMYYLSDNAKLAAVVWFLVGLFVYFIMTKKNEMTVKENHN